MDKEGGCLPPTQTDLSLEVVLWHQMTCPNKIKQAASDGEELT